MKVAVVVLADTETHEDLGRVVNAMVTTLEYKEAGDRVESIFDGGGTRWPPLLSQPDHNAHELYERGGGHRQGCVQLLRRRVRDDRGVGKVGVDLLDEYKRHTRLLPRAGCGVGESHLKAALQLAFRQVALTSDAEHDPRGRPRAGWRVCGWTAAT